MTGKNRTIITGPPGPSDRAVSAGRQRASNGSLTLTIEAQSGRARAGRLLTPHGVVPTPCFMPVGTQATVKSVSPDDLGNVGATMILANTYHLLLRPGPEVVAAHGGLHGFMAWQGPVLDRLGRLPGLEPGPLTTH